MHNFPAILSSPIKWTSAQLFFYKAALVNGNQKFLSSKSILLRPNKRCMQIDWRLNMFTVFFFEYSCLICLIYFISIWIDLENILNHLILLKFDTKYEGSTSHVYKCIYEYNFTNSTSAFGYCLYWDIKFIITYKINISGIQIFFSTKVKHEKGRKERVGERSFVLYQ